MDRNFVLSQGELKIPCRLLAPEDGNLSRLVLSVHGLGGSMDDGIQEAIAEEMELFYSAVLRFDFPAHGQSPLGCEDFTLTNCRRSLLYTAQWLREQYPQVEDLCIFATGFGAYVTLLELEHLLELPGKVKLVVQTPSLLMHEALLTMRGLSAPTLKAMGKMSFRSARPLDVTYEFYKELEENIALTQYPIPMLILHGELDMHIRADAIRNFRRLNESAKLVVIPGVGHRFLEEGAWDMVLDLTRDWFEFEQVLCCDWE